MFEIRGTKVYETRVGRKKLYASVAPGENYAKITLDCDVYELCEFFIPAAVVEELFERERTERRSLQVLLPALDPRLREVFITASTPAEFDETFGRPVLTRKQYGCYPEPEEG